MKVAVFGTKPYDRRSLEAANAGHGHELVFQRLLTFPNVLITARQAFFTENALKNIAETTLGNITDFENGRSSANEVTSRQIYRGS